MTNFSNLVELVQFIDKSYDNQTAFNFLENDKWISISNHQFAQNVYSLTLGLQSIGLQPQDGLGIIAKPSPFWLMIDFATMANGSIVVPIFADIAKNNLLFEIDNADVKVVFCDCLENLKILLDSGCKFKKIIIYGFEFAGENIIHFDDLLQNGQKIYQHNPHIFTDLISQIQPEDLATIIYTSGSTGVPKGVEITHQNLVSQIAACSQCFVLNKSDIALSFLPLAHIFERMVVGLYIAQGISIYFADDVKNVGNLLRQVQPTLITVVPRLLEKVFAKIKNGVEEAGFFKRILGQIAIKRLDAPKRNIAFDNLFDRLIYKKFRQALGGNLKMMICGGAPLAVNLEKFFWGIGVNLFVGYGLTETSPVIAVNYQNHHKIGTVGPTLFGVQTVLDKENELLVKGPNIMRGYHKNPEKTQEIMVDGWLKTGDLAHIDQDGFIKIIGRKKEMFKTANGKYVSPVPIEQKLVSDWQLLAAACIVAEGRKFVSCLLFPDFEILARYKQKAKLANLNDIDFLNSPSIKERTEKLIANVNKNLNHWEQIQKYYLAPHPISIATGELTPSMKLKRNFVEAKYQQQIDDFYG